MNRQATMQALPGLFGAAAQQQSVAPKRQDYAGSQSGSQSGEDVTKAKGSWLDTLSQIAGIVGQVGGAAMGMPGLGGMLSGMKGVQGAAGGVQANPQWYTPNYGASAAPDPFGLSGLGQDLNSPGYQPIR